MPAEDPQALIQEFERLSDELTHLIQRINKTNNVTNVTPDMTLADAIAVRDTLELKSGFYRDLAQSATVTQDIRTKSEIKFKGTVNVPQIQTRADTLAQEHRSLDTQIQETNWKTELL